jgi:hypothetical protein
MRYFIIIFFLLAALVLISCGGNTRNGKSMEKLVPTELQGWALDGEPVTYDRETIFDYINGAGEVYLAYGFKEVMVFAFSKPNSPEMTVEVFDMQSAEDAYGVFSHGRMDAETGIGQEYEYRGSLLCFWKGPYYVCVLAAKQTPESKEAVFAMARAIDERIDQTGPKPKIVSHLPDEYREPGSLRFFHVHASLNYHYFMAEDNILNLGPETDAVMARYEPGSSYLICITYPDSAQAEVARTRFISEYIPEADASGSSIIEDGQWVIVERSGRYVIIALDAPDEESGRRLVNECIENISRAREQGSV